MTAKGGPSNDKVGRYKSPEETGKVTRAVPTDTKHSPRWWLPTSMTALIGGAAIILLDFITALPGSYSPWWLLVGFLISIGGFSMLFNYR